MPAPKPAEKMAAIAIVFMLAPWISRGIVGVATFIVKAGFEGRPGDASLLHCAACHV
jgi:hypothetical protein